MEGLMCPFRHAHVHVLTSQQADYKYANAKAIVEWVLVVVA